MKLISHLFLPQLLAVLTVCSMTLRAEADLCTGMSMGDYAGSAHPSGESVGKLTGCFVQFDNKFHNRDALFWKNIVSDSNSAGMNLLIVQYVKMLPADESVPAVDYSSDLDALMSAVSDFNKTKPKNNSSVMIGLTNCDSIRWSNKIVSNESKTTSLLSKLTTENTSLLDHIKTKYAGKTDFGGFYIPLELWPFCQHEQGTGTPFVTAPVTDATLEKIRAFLRETRDKCKVVDSSGIVAASVYFNPWQYMDWVGPQKTHDMYSGIVFRDTKLDVMLLQDGTGTRIVETENVSGKLKECRPRALALTTQYFAAFYDACEQNGIKSLWDDIEVFTAGPSDGARNTDDPQIDWKQVTSATPSRVASQLDFMKSRKSQIKRGIAFEYLHYLDRNDPKCKPLYDFVNSTH